MRKAEAPLNLPADVVLLDAGSVAEQACLRRSYQVTRRSVDDHLAGKKTAKPATKTSWRKVLAIHPAAELLPMMGARELRELAADIERRGLQRKIDLHRNFRTDKEQILDGRNRLDALELLGRELVDSKGKLAAAYRGAVVTTRDPAEVTAWVISANIRRRHLDAAQKREVIGKLLKFDPKKSNRQVAKVAGVDHKTVAAARAEGEATGEIPRLKKTRGADGKDRKVKTPPTRAESEAADDARRAKKDAKRAKADAEHASAIRAGDEDAIATMDLWLDDVRDTYITTFIKRFPDTKRETVAASLVALEAKARAAHPKAKPATKKANGARVSA